jgi:hypothetical protein
MAANENRACDGSQDAADFEIAGRDTGIVNTANKDIQSAINRLCGVA